MVRSLWGKFFLLLLLVSAVGLSATFVLRSMMLRDFESFLDGEQLDHVYIVAAGLEGAWERGSAWDVEALSGNTVLALMLGMEIRHEYADGPKRRHSWESGWVPEAVRMLVDAN